MKKISIEIKWAFIFLGMSLLWMLLEKLTGLHSTHIDKHMYLTNLFAIPAILVYVFALRDKKRNYYQGSMSFQQGFVAGVIITGIVTLFTPATQWITSEVISPEYFPNVIVHSVEVGYFQTVEAAEAAFNLQTYIVQSTIGALVMGMITSAVVAFFLKSKSKNG